MKVFIPLAACVLLHGLMQVASSQQQTPTASEFQAWGSKVLAGAGLGRDSAEYGELDSVIRQLAGELTQQESDLSKLLARKLKIERVLDNHPSEIARLSAEMEETIKKIAEQEQTGYLNDMNPRWGKYYVGYRNGIPYYELTGTKEELIALEAQFEIDNKKYSNAYKGRLLRRSNEVLEGARGTRIKDLGDELLAAQGELENVTRQITGKGDFNSKYEDCRSKVQQVLQRLQKTYSERIPRNFGSQWGALPQLLESDEKSRDAAAVGGMEGKTGSGQPFERNGGTRRLKPNPNCPPVIFENPKFKAMSAEVTNLESRIKRLKQDVFSSTDRVEIQAKVKEMSGLEARVISIRFEQGLMQSGVSVSPEPLRRITPLRLPPSPPRSGG
jgi:hypothetical protein